MNRTKHWYDYLWIWAIVYFSLGMFNILFAWLGMIDFCVPLFFAVFRGSKKFCSSYCDRGQLLALLGGRAGLSMGRPTPRWMSSKAFRFGFLLFFTVMFANMIFQTWLTAAGASSLVESIKLFWTFSVPWNRAYSPGLVPDWVARYSFGLYGMMLTSMLIGLIVMIPYRPRTWCSFCPMGTATQMICRLKASKFKGDAI